MDKAAPHGEALWYAVSTRSRQEKIAASVLENLAIGYFLPLINEERQWSDRKQMIALPLFPGYVFVRIARSSELQLRVLKVPGIVNFVGNQSGPLAIPENEIESVRAAILHGAGCSPHPFLKTGDRVRVVRGVLAGLEGTLIRCGERSKLVISVEMIQRSVSVSVAGSDVKPALPAVQHQFPLIDNFASTRTFSSGALSTKLGADHPVHGPSALVPR
jgi:transcription antitermination factor NusG